ncbi:MAG: metal-sensitive transcriptional regulator [Micropepsaceae bacterium]
MAHSDSLKSISALKRIEGQVRGIGKMVEEDRYCIDIVTQIAAARAALTRVEADLLRGHIGHCVHKAMKSGDNAERAKVVDELVTVFGRR